MRRTQALLMAISMAAPMLAGCLSGQPSADPSSDERETSEGLTDARTRHLLAFESGEFSRTLEPGPYALLPSEGVFIDVTVPSGNGFATQRVHLGLFLPDVAAGTLVPVIADVGPYYGEPVLGDVHATEPANRLGRFLIENFVPHGYAVAQVSVLGTGDSGGCMDLMGPVEQAGVQAAVEWLGTQSWSNGRVGLIGRSYDGSTPWEAAMVPAEHLATIVPISGLYGLHDLMWRNGSAEYRAPAVLWGLYYAFTYTGNEGNPTLQAQQVVENAVCPDTQTGGAQALAAYVTGDEVAPPTNPYFAERSFREGVLEHYQGSVYFIHGLQDWNVDPHMAFPMYQQLEAQGLEVKGLFGQWGHNYPDRPNEHDNLRWDWAQDLLEWFEYTLKQTGPAPPMRVEVQDDRGQWRIESTYPPADAQWRRLVVGADLIPIEGDAYIIPGPYDPTGETVDQRDVLRLASDPLLSEIRIAGMAQLPLVVTPLGPGGQVYAELRQVDQDGDTRRIAHAIMDLRFAAGGKTAVPVTPGIPLEAKIEFFAADTSVPAGSRLELLISNVGRDYLPSTVSAPVEIHLDGDGALLLPLIERGPHAFFPVPAPAGA